MKKGISLVALVVTIIVLIILTGAIVLTAFNNGILDRSEEAVFKSDMKSFQEELTMYIMNKKAEFTYSEVNVIYNDNEDEHYNNMKEYINSFSKKYASKVQIVKDKIEYIGTDDQEKQWVSGLGITVNSIEVVGDISDWEITQGPGTNDIMIIGYKGAKTENLEIPNVLTIEGEKKNVTYIQLQSSNNNLSGSLTVPSNVRLMFLDLDVIQNVNKIIIKDNVIINNNSSWASFEGNLEEVIVGNNCTIQRAFPKATIGNLIIGDNCNIDMTSLDVNINDNLIIGKNANLGFCAFANANILGKVIIGDNSVMDAAFSGAFVRSVKIGNNCVLGNDEFFQCETLKTVELGENVFVAKQAFVNCPNLEGTINIPASTSVQEKAFYGCSKADIVILGTLTYEGTDAFTGCKSVTRK